MLVTPHSSPRSQRWRDRRITFVGNDTTIDPRDFSVDLVHSTSTARQFVRQHHYLGTLPPSRLIAGLYRNGGGGRSDLVGVCAFTVPMNNNTVPLHLGIPPNAGLELGRLVLLDDVAANGESFFVSRALRLLRQHKPDVEGIVSFADPVARYAPDGRLITPGHVGLVYRALSFLSRPRRPPRVHHVTPCGQSFSARAASKIRRREQGWRYAVDQLITAGAPPPSGDDLADWYSTLLRSGFLQRQRHPGNFVYAFPLTRAAKAAARRLPLALPPVKGSVLTGSDVSALPLWSAASN